MRGHLDSQIQSFDLLDNPKYKKYECLLNILEESFGDDLEILNQIKEQQDEQVSEEVSEDILLK